MKKVSRKILSTFLAAIAVLSFNKSNNQSCAMNEVLDKGVMGSEPFFNYKGTLNVLIIGKNKADPVKISRLLGENTKGITLSQIGDKDYQEGKVYYPENNKNLRFIYFTIDKFLSPDFEKEYDGEFIAQNMNIGLYMVEDYADVLNDLKKFYHKFNKFWCGKDFSYEENVDGKCYGYGGAEDYTWFNSTVKKRDILEHRYIYFLYNAESKFTWDKFFVCKCPWSKDHNVWHNDDCSNLVKLYVQAMPDARSIHPCELKKDSNNIEILHEFLTPRQGFLQDTILYDNDNIFKNKFVKSRYFPFVVGGIGLAILGSLGYLGYRIYQNKSKNSKNLRTRIHKMR